MTRARTKRKTNTTLTHDVAGTLQQQQKLQYGHIDHLPHRQRAISLLHLQTFEYARQQEWRLFTRTALPPAVSANRPLSVGKHKRHRITFVRYDTTGSCVTSVVAATAAHASRTQVAPSLVVSGNEVGLVAGVIFHTGSRHCSVRLLRATMHFCSSIERMRSVCSVCHCVNAPQSSDQMKQFRI